MIPRTLVASILAITILFIQPLISAAQVHALVKSCFLTKIGPNAPQDIVFPPGCQSGGAGITGSCGAVVDFAQQINDKLNPNDNLTSEVVSPCGRTTPRSAWAPPPQYWCAYTVSDSYNLAGIPGLSGASVIGLHNQMTNNPAFTFADYRTNKEAVLKQVKPGWAFFIEGRFGVHVGGQQHTGIIKTITLDERGNGTIVTLESNGGKLSKTWPIANWVVIHGDDRPLVAFGGGK